MRSKLANVLVVDDDAGSRFVLTRALECLGLDPVVAEDGADVPDLIAAQRFDLLVVDLQMPGMNGFELLRQIRRSNGGLLPMPRTCADVPILVVSGESNAASIANAVALGADDYLVKPIDLDIFERVVGRLMPRRTPEHKSS
ncbi:MAG: response regulator [Candidatus Binatia bacterium]